MRTAESTSNNVKPPAAAPATISAILPLYTEFIAVFCDWRVYDGTVTVDAGDSVKGEIDIYYQVCCAYLQLQCMYLVQLPEQSKADPVE